MLVVGCFLPWVSVGALFVQRGLDTFLGAVVLLSGLIAAGLALHNIVKKQNRMKYAYLVIGVLGLLIGVYGLLQIRDIKTTAGFVDALQQQMGAERDMEALMGIMSTGLWFVTLGGLILAGTGLVNAFSQRVDATPSPR